MTVGRYFFGQNQIVEKRAQIISTIFHTMQWPGQYYMQTRVFCTKEQPIQIYFLDEIYCSWFSNRYLQKIMLDFQNFTNSISWPCGVEASIETCHAEGLGSNPIGSRKKSFFQNFPTFGGKIQISVRKSTTVTFINLIQLRLSKISN